jgi:hypothetical protein
LWQLSDFNIQMLPALIKARADWLLRLDVSVTADDLTMMAGKLASLNFTVTRSEFEWDTSSVNGTVVTKLLST